MGDSLKGKYSYDLQSREPSKPDWGCSLTSSLGSPRLSVGKVCLPGNIDPDLQLGVLEQVSRPELVVCDTMNYWIRERKPPCSSFFPESMFSW